MGKREVLLHMFDIRPVNPASPAGEATHKRIRNFERVIKLERAKAAEHRALLRRAVRTKPSITPIHAASATQTTPIIPSDGGDIFSHAGGNSSAQRGLEGHNFLPSREELLRFFEGKIARFWMPDDVVFVDSLPIGGTGKIQKNKLREQFRDYRLPGA